MLSVVFALDGNLVKSGKKKFSDKEPPKFDGCPTKAVFVLLYETVETLSPPNVTDNSGAVASFNVSYNLNRPIAVPMNIIWKAADHADKTAEPCEVEVLIKGICLNVSLRNSNLY